MRRILILIDGSSNDGESLRAAAVLCGMTGASLTVVHPRPAARRIMSAADMVVVVEDDGEARARAAFAAECGGLPQARLLTYDAEADAILAWLGHAYDLILIERLSREAGPEAEALNAALFETGRPVLLLPPLPHAATFRQPVLAWNGTALNARAIRSALPLLQPAGQAIVLFGAGLGSPAPLLEYLGSYGVAAEMRPYESGGLTARARGRALIAAAVANGADLLVTGAFGEAVPGSILGLGRATRKIVTAAPMPVLMQS